MLYVCAGRRVGLGSCIIMLFVLIHSWVNILSADCYVGFLPVLQAIGGVLKEFIFAPRIDNLMNCYTGMQVHVVYRLSKELLCDFYRSSTEFVYRKSVDALIMRTTY